METQKIDQDDQKQEKDNSTFNFWQDHCETFLQMAFRCDYREKIQNPDAYGKQTGHCGDTVEFFVMVENNRIKTISFDIDGCINTNACANAVVELVKGKSIEEAWRIKPEDIETFLETLPPDHKHCAELSAGAFYLTLASYRELKSSSWKKMYPIR